MTEPVTAAPPIDKPIEEYAEPALGTGLLLALTLAWLAVCLLGTRFAFPTAVAASLLAGSAAGLTTISVLAERGWLLRPPVRFGFAALAGAAIGVLALIAILIAHGTDTVAVVFAVTVGVAGVLGGTLGAAPPRPIATAGLTATLGAFVASFAVYSFREPLIAVFGYGTSDASRYAAAGWFAATEAVLSAVVAGLLAFWALRRIGRLTGATPRWPAYLLAGATPGLLLVLGEAITRIGGASLFNHPVSAFDRTVLSISGSSRVNHALVVLFLGAIVATVAFGRTLPRRAEDSD
ncbi:MAG TPA: hypothetical protein VFE14_05495 [Micromonosporaceae bacterium]|nr:hypothetical protein [Micromonosporaceae bacterium]